MVYTIYETDSIIFDIKNIQENDCLIRAFSDKFGFISIIATSFRKETSKLKANIKPFSINKIAIVRGKEFFRLTDVNHKFSFINSKSLVSFLKFAESLFFNDERDYFEQVNKDIYNMIIHLCKFIIYIIKSEVKNKKFFIDIVNVFFAVYVRGLQGFVEKIDLFDLNSSEGEFLCEWFEKNKDILTDLNNKILFV